MAKEEEKKKKGSKSKQNTTFKIVECTMASLL
jgi:hypothetical protein